MNCPYCHRHIDDRPKGDFMKGIPSSAEFERTFTEPVSFGDEDDWLLVSRKLPVEEALAKIRRTMIDDWGYDEDSAPKTVDDLTEYDVGWGTDYDSYRYSEGCYWICSGTNQVTPRWKAWGVQTQ